MVQSSADILESLPLEQGGPSAVHSPLTNSVGLPVSKSPNTTPGSDYKSVTPINQERLVSVYLVLTPHVPSSWSHPIRSHTSVLLNAHFMDAY